MAKRPQGSLDSIGISKTEAVIPHQTPSQQITSSSSDVVEAKVTSQSKPRLAKALTLKLTEEEYERLRGYAFTTKRSHQSVIREAVLGMLDKKNA